MVDPGQWLKDKQTIYQRVVALAREKPCVKGDYNLLTAYYWWTYNRRLFGVKEFKELLEMPSSESISRMFRKAVENGDIVSTEKMLARRKQHENLYRNYVNETAP